MSMPVATSAKISSPPLPLARLGDYVQLCRPRIAVMVLITAMLGALLAGVTEAAIVVQMLVGTALVTAGASMFNQLLERHTDALMVRTENRPLPAGRLSIGEVFIAGSALTAAGLAVLGALPTGPLSAIIAGTTFVLYVFAYTPTKKRTWWNTFVGAVPGAAPPLIGWAAANGTLELAALPLFAVLFFWQVPHFLAIAWMYREDYQRAGLVMLPTLDATGVRTWRTMAIHTLLLVAVSVLPFAFESAVGWPYLAVALVLGLAFLLQVIRFAVARDHATARSVLRMSLVYLPALLLALFVDRMI